MNREAMRAAWENFDRGDVGHLKDVTLEEMLTEAEAGERYLEGRGDRLVSFKVTLDIGRLKDILRERKVQVQRETRRLRERYGDTELCGLPPGEFPALERAQRR